MTDFFQPSARSAATVAYLKRCHLCFICPELKQIKVRRAQQSVTEQRGHPGLAGTFAALSFSSVSPGPALRASCESGQPVRERHLGRIGPMNEERVVGAGGSWKVSEAGSLAHLVLMCVGFDPSGTLN